MKINKDVCIKSFFNWDEAKKLSFVSFFESLSDEQYEFVQCISVKKGKVHINDSSFDFEKKERFVSFVKTLTPQQKEYVCVFALLSPLARVKAGLK